MEQHTSPEQSGSEHGSAESLRAENAALRSQLESAGAERAELKAKLKEAEEVIRDLRRFAIEDALTGLENRKALPERAEKRRASGKEWSLALLDVDFFKKVNDTYGHDAGDAVLKAVAEHLRVLFREEDAVIRYGGEEFAVILKDANPQEVINKLYNKADGRAEINLEVEIAPGKKIPVSVSGGVAEFTRDERIDDAIARADAALYASKDAGRNRLTVWAPAPERKQTAP